MRFSLGLHPYLSSNFLNITGNLSVNSAVGLDAPLASRSGTEDLRIDAERHRARSLFPSLATGSRRDLVGGGRQRLAPGGLSREARRSYRRGGLQLPAAGLVARFKGASDRTALVDDFPDIDPAAVRLALLRLLQTDERHLDVLLAEPRDELQFHIATNLTLRETILKLAVSQPEDGQALRKRLATNQQFVGRASRILRKLEKSVVRRCQRFRSRKEHKNGWLVCIEHEFRWPVPL